MCSAIRGNEFTCFFFSTLKPKIGQVCRKWNPKSTRFARVTWFGNFWWRIYLSFLYFEKLSVVLSFFFNSLSYGGERFYFFFQFQQAKNRACRSKMHPKFDLPDWLLWFGYFGGRKSRFLNLFEIFLELFMKCLGSLLPKNAYFCLCFQLQRLITDLENQKFR